MGLLHGVSPITFFCVHNISLYISNFLKKNKQSSSVHNTDTFYTQVQTNSDRLLFFTCVYSNQHSLCTYFHCAYQKLFMKNKLLSVHNTDTLFENTFSQINFD